MIDCSVVIPVFNRKDRVQRAIDSVVHQSVPLREIIVVDDGSTDGLAEFVGTNYPNIKFLRQSNRGVSAARNLGIAESQGEWIAFLDSDDEWLPSKLEQQWHWLQSHLDIKICHCDEYWVRNDIRVNPGKRHKKRGGWIYLHCLPLCVISPSAVLINRQVFHTVGVFDESLPVCEDYDLWLRVTQTFEVGYVDQPLLVKYGGHSDQLSKAYRGMDRFRVTALLKSLEQGRLSELQRKKTIETLVEKVKIYLNGAQKRKKLAQVAAYQKILDDYEAKLRQME